MGYSQQSVTEWMEVGGKAHPNSHRDLSAELDPEARALYWADSGEPGERQLGLVLAALGDPGLPP